ncbi:MAG: hypothetical protein WCK00_04380 [Deltaproteobacteria bacterium]
MEMFVPPPLSAPAACREGVILLYDPVDFDLFCLPFSVIIVFFMRDDALFKLTGKGVSIGGDPEIHECGTFSVGSST